MQIEFNARTRRVSRISRTRAQAACSVSLPLLPSSRGGFECSSDNDSLAIFVFTGNKFIRIEFHLNLEEMQIEFDARNRRVSRISRTRARGACSVSLPPLLSSWGDFECSSDNNSLAIIVSTGNRSI